MCDQVVERDMYPDVRLDKLDRLGREMCYSVVGKSDDIMGNTTGKGSSGI